PPEVPGRGLTGPPSRRPRPARAAAGGRATGTSSRRNTDMSTLPRQRDLFAPPPLPDTEYLLGAADYAWRRCWVELCRSLLSLALGQSAPDEWARAVARCALGPQRVAAVVGRSRRREVDADRMLSMALRMAKLRRNEALRFGQEVRWRFPEIDRSRGDAQ